MQTCALSHLVNKFYTFGIITLKVKFISHQSCCININDVKQKICALSGHLQLI